MKYDISVKDAQMFEQIVFLLTKVKLFPLYMYTFPYVK